MISKEFTIYLRLSLPSSNKYFYLLCAFVCLPKHIACVQFFVFFLKIISSLLFFPFLGDGSILQCSFIYYFTCSLVKASHNMEVTQLHK